MLGEPGSDEAVIEFRIVSYELQLVFFVETITEFAQEMNEVQESLPAVLRSRQERLFSKTTFL